jgi:uncharacterized protein (TIGR01777 family)
MKVAISGATGLIGTALRESLAADGIQIVALSRGAARAPQMETIQWDVENGRFDASGLEDTHAVVHLAGEPIAQRWTDARKRAIRDSRVKSTRLLVEGLKSLSRRPKVLISGSAIGFYGDRGDETLVESSPAGTGFLPETCQAWEHAAMEAMGLGIRTAVLRTGIVLSTKGGALKKMLLPFRLGAGGPVGNGRQWMSWIHIDDIVGAIRHALEKDEVMAAVNGVAPEPVTNAEFGRALGRALSRPAFLPAPAFALRIGFGEMSSILLEGQKVLPKKLLDTGYRFRFPDLAGALADILARKR